MPQLQLPGQPSQQMPYGATGPQQSQVKGMLTQVLTQVKRVAEANGLSFEALIAEVGAARQNVPPPPAMARPPAPPAALPPASAVRQMPRGPTLPPGGVPGAY